MSDDNAARPSGLPKPEEILASLVFDDQESKRLQHEAQSSFERDAIRAEMEWAHLQGLQDHYWHKGVWSWFLMGLLVFMILFQSGLLFSVGLGWLDFQAYRWLLPALLVQNLGQIIALAYVVVKSLFR